MVCFAEPLEVDHLPLAQELDNVVYVRIVAEAQDVIVGDAGFLLWCNHESATSYRKWRKNTLNCVRNAVNLALEAFQRLLQCGPVYVQIAGGQAGQSQHLLQGALNLAQGLVDGLDGFFKFFFGLHGSILLKSSNGFQWERLSFQGCVSQQ